MTGKLRSSAFRKDVAKRYGRNLRLQHEQQLVSTHRGRVTSLCMDHIEGRFFLSTGADAAISVFDLSKWGSDGYMNGTGAPYNSFRPVAQAQRASGGRAGGHSASVVRAQWFSVDTGAFVSTSCDGCVFVWDTQIMKPAARWKPFPTIQCAHLSPSLGDSQSLLAIGSVDESRFKLVDIRTGSASHSFNSGPTTVLQWSPTCDVILASGGLDGTVRIWDIRKAGSGSAVTSLDRDNDTPMARRSFRPDYRHLRRRKKTAPNNFRHVEMDSIRSHGNAISGLSFTRDGHFMVSAGRDGKLQLWDLRANGHLMPRQFHRRANQSAIPISQSKTPISIHQDTNMAWVGYGQSIVAYSLETGGEPREVLAGHLNDVSALESIHDNMEFLSGGADGMILTWGMKGNSEDQRRRKSKRKRVL